MEQCKKVDKYIMFSVILYRILLDVVYVITVNRYYLYSGFLNQSSFSSLFFSYLHVIIYFPFIKRSFKKERFTEYVLLLLGLIYFIPGTSLMAFIPMKMEMLLAWNIFWLCLFLTDIGISHIRMLRIKITGITIRNKWLFGIALGFLFCTVVMYISYRYTNFRFLITFRNEYELRAEQRGYTMGRLLKYLYGMSPILISSMLCMACTQKRYWLAFILMIVQVFSFAIGGHKFYLLVAVLAIMIGCLYEKVYKRFGNATVLCGLISMLMIEIFERIVLGTFKLSANISRRVLFLPQLLNYFYYDFFSRNPFVYFRQGILRWLGAESEYSENISLIIGETYVGENCNANNGLFSEAYSNFGILGCVILPFLLVLILKLLEIWIRGQDNSIILFFAAACALIFGSGNISTGLLSNGIIVTALFFMLFRGQRRSEK